VRSVIKPDDAEHCQWSRAKARGRLDTTEGALGVRVLHLHGCSIGASWRNGSNDATHARQRAGGASSCRAAGADAAVPGKRHGASEDGTIAVKALPAVKARGVSTRGAPGGARKRVAATKEHRAPEREKPTLVLQGCERAGVRRDRVVRSWR